MDQERFDHLARAVASRRRVLRRLAVGVAALGLTTPAVAEAARRHGHARAQTDAATSHPHAPAAATARKGKQSCQTGFTACTVGKKRHRKHICADLAADSAHCGNCKQACASGETCQQGNCGVADPCAGCQANQVCCDNTCVDGACCFANDCPGFQTANTNVTCTQNHVCTFSCQGEHYDVDGDPSTGCEAADVVTGNHTFSNATSLGSQDCFDSSTGAFSGTIYSDGRVHETPAITGFDATTGAAPDWFVVDATGGACQDDLSVTIKVTSGTPQCYKLSVITDKNTFSAQVSANNGSATITAGASSYTDHSNIYFKVEKTCGTSVREAAAYAVGFHL